MKAIPFWLAVFLTLVKCGFLITMNQMWLAFGWVIVGLWIISIGYAYLKDRELPMLGMFDYREGKNQPARAIATYMMSLLFLATVVFDTKW
jgi:hypothetical protein